MKRFIGMLMLVAFALSMATVASASPPAKQKAFTSNAIVVEQVAPVANLVPVMIGYDVIENISQESGSLSIAQNTFNGRYIGEARLSSTGAWRSHYASTSATARSSPPLTKR